MVMGDGTSFNLVKRILARPVLVEMLFIDCRSSRNVVVGLGGRTSMVLDVRNRCVVNCRPSLIDTMLSSFEDIGLRMFCDTNRLICHE